MTLPVNYFGSYWGFFGLLLILVLTTRAHSLETEDVVATHGNRSKYRLFPKVNLIEPLPNGGIALTREKSKPKLPFRHPVSNSNLQLSLKTRWDWVNFTYLLFAFCQLMMDRGSLIADRFHKPSNRIMSLIPV